MWNFLWPAGWANAYLSGGCPAHKLIACIVLFLVAGVATAAEPDALIPVGDSPFALSLSADGRQAVVVNLFPVRNPDGSTGPNIRLLDLVGGTQVNAFQLGTRLVSVALSGTTALLVNEDQDVLRLVNVANGQEIAQIPVGSRPSNVVVTGPDTAIVTNGTSGDLSFINLRTGTVIGVPVTVGNDPRSIALHPGGRFAYITLGGENALAVLDLQSPNAAALTEQGARVAAVLGKVAVGKNPVAVEVTPDGSRAVVANLTSNTVSVLDLANPAIPRALMNVPVGVQPTAIAIHPQNQSLVYVSNLGSPYFSVLDLRRQQQSALAGVVEIGSPSSGIAVTSDGARLAVLEFRNQANLRLYNLPTLQLDPAPAVEIPGEPRLSSFLDASGICSFYIAEATLAPGQREGFWGMEVLVSQGQLTGGFNLGGGFAGNGQLPGFGAFSLSTPQRVTINVAAQALPGATGQVGLDVALKKDGQRVAGANGAPPLNFSADLTPGFHVVEIVSAPGSPRGTFQMGLEALGFSGGVVVGGFITEGLTGFGAFCVPQSQNVDMRLVGNSEYGEAAAGDLILTLRDAGRNVLASINTSIPLAEPVAPPAPPDISGLNIRWYVDASASANGTGTSASPFRSITRALTQAQAGQVIFVRPGRYSPSSTGEVLPMNGARTGVRLIGAGAANTIIDGERVNQNAVVIAAANVRMAGFTIRNAGQAGLFVFRSNNVVVENNLFTSNVRFGVGALESRGLIVRNNVAVSNLESGMAFSGSTPQALTNAPTNCPASPAGAYGAYVINNVASDNRADGILVTQGGNVCVAGNVTRTNGSSGIEFNNRAEGVALPALHGTIVNNEIVGNGGVQFGFAGTGILVTEGARGDLIQGNSLLNNRPFGIGIFLNGEAGRIVNNTVLDTSAQGILVQRGSHADEISDNTVRNSGASALFVENSANVDLIARNTASGNGIGLSVLERSSVGTVDQNVLDRNGVGMEVVNSGITAVRNSSFQGSGTGGVFVRQSSTVGGFHDNQVRNNRGQGGMLVDASTVTVSGGAFSGNGGGGMSLFAGANVTIQNARLDSNQAPGGLFLVTGAKATLTGTTLNANTQQGILAADAGTTVTLSGGNAVTNTQGIGLNAQNGASISCTGSNNLGGNSGGNTFGSVTGCQ